MDWRLGLDVAALAAGLPLPTHRWLPRSHHLADTFVRAYAEPAPCHIADAGGLQAIVRDDRKTAVLLGHPLWFHDEQRLNAEQAESYDILRSDLGVQKVVVSDLFVLDRIQPRILKELMGDGT